ncbi:EI24 domain-containing protein [Algirhabdus cladophorae]|uniref:EI24 domain-containing protein n=1 Tax=Algirhabdus cladophorae TaxID=3377108 RepID=UPI003B84A0B0
MILDSFFKALGQLPDPRFRKVLLMGVGLTVALLFGIYAIFLLALQALFPDTLTLPLLGEVTWVDDLLSWGSILLMLILSTFLMVPVASAITGLFLDDVAEAVEAKHYAHLPRVPRTPFLTGLKDGINFLGILVAANLAALVLYFFFAPFAPLIFWAMNGLLLGREYFQLTALRRLGPVKAKQMRKKYAGKIWIAGALMAVPLSIPLVNLLIPVLGAATFTHIYHSLGIPEDPA